MASVDDIRAQENYLVLKNWSPEKRPILRLYPLRRNWTRTNYEMDLRYIETIMNEAIASMPQHVTKVIVQCDCSNVSIFSHYRPTLFERSIADLRAKFGQRVYEVHVENASLSARLMFWLYAHELPYSMANKIKWV